MKSTVLNILIIVLVLLFIAISFIVYVIFRTNFVKNEKSRILKKINDDFELKKISKVEIVYNKVRKIIKKNSIYFSVFNNDISKLQESIEKQIEAINLSINDLNIKSDRLKYKDFLLKNKMLNKAMADLEADESSFFKLTNKISEESDFLLLEFQHINSLSRKVFNKFNEKRIVLNFIVKEINNLIDDIAYTANEFDKKLYIDGDLNLAKDVLATYGALVYKFADVVEKAPDLNSYLDANIFKLMDRLTKKYKNSKVKLNNSLGHIRFSKTIDNLKNIFEESKKSLFLMDVPKTENGIKNIIKSIKIMDKMIDYELESYEVYNNQLSKLEIIIKKVFQELSKLYMIRTRLKKSKKMPKALSSRFTDIFEKAQIISTYENKFNAIKGNNGMAYSAKVSKAKILINSLLEIQDEINIMNNLIWEIDIIKTVQINKLNHADNALTKIVSNFKSEKLLFSEEHENTFINLTQQIQRIREKISNRENTIDFKVEINILIKKVSEYIKIVGGIYQIAIMTKKTITELGHQRILKPALHTELQIAERQYLLGKYDGALNIVITQLEEK